MYLTNLGTTLQTRFERTGDLAALDEAIELCRRAVAATAPGHPDRAARLSNLGGVLHGRFVRTGSTPDLDQAITADREAIEELPAGHPDRVRIQSNLAVLLRARFGRTGQSADLEAATAVARQAVEDVPGDHPSRARYLANLGIVLWTGYEHTAVLADLDEAAAVLRQAADAVPGGHPDLATIWSNLAVVLRARFDRTGQLADLDAAIAIAREAAAAVPADHPDSAGRLANLANMVQLRHGHSGAAGDEQEAQGLFTHAARSRHARPSIRIDTSRAAVRLNGGKDAQLCAGLLEMAVGLLPEVAARHLVRDDQQHALGSLADLSSDAAAMALLDTSRPEPERAVRALRLLEAGRSVLLSQALDTRSDLTDLGGVHPDLARRYVELRELLDWAPAAMDLGGLGGPGGPGGLGGSVAPDRRALAVEFDAVLEGIRSLPGFGSFARLPDLADLISDADAGPVVTFNVSSYRSDALVLTGEGIIAVPLPGLGRDVLNAQVLAFHQALASADGGRAVIGIEDGELAAHPLPGVSRDVLDAQVLAFHQALADADGGRAVIGVVGGELAAHPLPGVGRDVLDAQVLAFDQALAGADGGRAVVGIEGGELVVRPLPGVSRDVLDAQVLAFDQALVGADDGRAVVGVEVGELAAQRDADLAVAGEQPQAVIRGVLAWLWEFVTEPVLTALGYDRAPVDGEVWPRVWWSTGGLLGLLPVHAAGRYEPDNPDNPGHTVLDRVISSYTPTIRALQHARRQVAAARATQAGNPAAEPGRSLIVAMPTTPGLPASASLPGAAREARLLVDRLPAAVVLREPDPGALGSEVEDHGSEDQQSSSVPTHDAVLEHLPHCAIAHFACHGASDHTDPSRSRLLLHDHATRPLTIAALAPVRLDRAELAYLSACHTAMPGAQLLDESIQLASAFQLAGFPHVVAALWQIMDPLAPEVADAFYARLEIRAEGPEGAAPDRPILDTSRAAEALHQTVRALRDREPDRPSLWAAYIHAGV